MLHFVPGVSIRLAGLSFCFDLKLIFKSGRAVQVEDAGVTGLETFPNILSSKFSFSISFCPKEEIQCREQMLPENQMKTLLLALLFFTLLKDIDYLCSQSRHIVCTLLCDTQEKERVQTVSIQLCGPMRPQFDFLLAFYPVTVETQNPCYLCLF